jgi:hypothetical protein
MEKYRRENFKRAIQPGDIVFIRTETAMGKLIRWTTDSNINHVAYYIGNGLIIESTLGYGVRILPLNVYIDDMTTEIFLGRVEARHDIWEAITYSYNFYGMKYDILGQIGIFVRFMVQKIGLQKLITFFGPNLTGTNGLWCSEFVGLVFSSVSIKFNSIDISYLSPSDIYNSPIVRKIEF